MSHAPHVALLLWFGKKAPRQQACFLRTLSSMCIRQVSSSQKSPVLSVACGPRLDVFTTCTQDGTVRVWDLCDFGVVAEVSHRQREAVCRALCICWLGEEAMVSAWSDCCVRYAVGLDLIVHITVISVSSSIVPIFCCNIPRTWYLVYI